ncbi:MAG: hypothetical protein K2H85_03695, partial [Allobaculum sp.]|nr:hypothetical protein [Allobaculum sp.]
MEDISSEFEKMIETADVQDLTFETSQETVECTVTLKVDSTDLPTSAVINIQNNKLTIGNQIQAFQQVTADSKTGQSEYYFKKALSDINVSSTDGKANVSIELGKKTFSQIANELAFNPKLPVTLQYFGKKDNDAKDQVDLPIYLENWDEIAKDNTTISKEKLNEKLSTKLYRVKANVEQSKLIPIFYETNGKITPFYYVLHSTQLETVTLNSISNTYIPTLFSTGKTTTECSLLIGDLKPDKDGNVILNPENLATALTNMSKRDGDNITFKASSSTNWTKSFSIYELSKLDLKSLATEGVSLTMTLSPQSGFFLEIKDPDKENILIKRYVTLSEIDTKEKNSKISAEEMEEFIKKNYENFVFSSQGFKATDFDFSDVKFLTTGLIPTASLKVGYSLKGLSGSFNTQTYTLKFEDTAQKGKIVDTTSKSWEKLFHSSVQDTLTRDLVAGDVLPTGYDVALIQKPGSTAKSGKELGKNDCGDFAISKYGPKEVVIYVTKKEGYKPIEGTVTTKPTAPEELPVTPQPPVEQPTAPEQPSIPSQGSQVMYRLFNAQTGEHFYTRSASEKENVLAQEGWRDEGHGWTAPAISSFPVYRVFNPNSGEHHYTKDKNEYETLIHLGWNGEGHAFYS